MGYQRRNRQLMLGQDRLFSGIARTALSSLPPGSAMSIERRMRLPISKTATLQEEITVYILVEHDFNAVGKQSFSERPD